MNKGILVLASLAMASSASAATTTDNPFAQDKAVLNLAGLDLSTADGQQRLAIRTDQAARAVCGDQLSSVHLVLDEKARACQAAVTADIRHQIEVRTANTAKTSPARLASSN